MQGENCDLKVHINGQQIFLLNQRIACNFSGRLRDTTKQERRRGGGGGHSRILDLKFTDFPGGPDGFELVARFCYNNGRILMNPSNICLLHSSASFLEMTEEFIPCNLLSQAETFLDGLFYWTWDEILTSIKTCEQFFHYADSSGLLQRLVSSLLTKIAANSELALTTSLTPLPSSSLYMSRFRFSSITKTPDTMKPCSTKEWWFDDLTILHPKIIEKIITTLGAYGSDNRSLILITRFLLHYLSNAAHGNAQTKLQYSGLADTAVHGVVLMGRKSFSCRGLFWVLRIVSGLGLSRECRQKLENLIGLMLDQATLDDLLVSGHGPVYDVSLVLRLVRIFVGAGDGTVPMQSLKKVGWLLDKYLGEISPDQSLKATKFLGLAESLPDSARDCYDGVYRALDIYLQTHPSLSTEDKARLCRCLNYVKLTSVARIDLAKNPRIPPRAAVQALLVSQRASVQPGRGKIDEVVGFPWPAETRRTAVYYKGVVRDGELPPPVAPELPKGKEKMRLHLQKTQWKVVELEKRCRETKGHMSTMAKDNATAGGDRISQHRRQQQSHHITGRGLPRLC